LTKVETRAAGNGQVAVGRTAIRRLPVSRKATNPRLTRVESVVLLVLLVALSILVLVGVSGATRAGSAAACSANAAAVGNGLAALKAENSGGLPTSSAGWERALLYRGQFIGGPFLRSWPRSPVYAIRVAGVGAAEDTGDAVVPGNGDVLVIVLASHLVYDATTHVAVACAAV
jgi:hypothetical protein